MDPATFALFLSLGVKAIQGGEALWSWWQKIHQITQETVRLTPEQSVQLDALIAGRDQDPNWQPDAAA